MMNAEDIIKLSESLTLKENEGPLMKVTKELMKDGGRHMFLRLIGKLLSNKPMNREVFLVVMLKIWRTLKGFEIEVIGGNAFSFTCDDDKRRILHGGLWSFDNALLVIEEPLGKGDIQDMRFINVSFWIQIHRVPLICMTSEIGRFLGDLIGEVKEVGDGRSQNCVEKRLEHVVRDCGVRPSLDKWEDFTVLYGPWLRASSRLKFGKGRGSSKDTCATERQMRGNNHDGLSQDWNGERENQL
ncbi:hypothetical protein Ddye_021720 [Dipteronia dyeriana]|uniref:DUF4283 domain-containing protein n=1 Tax=Dipteronia dyeriana TaxID=168575 RepID=A0AAD9U368_9ROSI|nr:hypothetical protein Ddye_021720 [Dipteronia dyeriana]